MHNISLEDLKKIMPDIFRKVKRDVRKITGRKRAGISLGLVEMGMFQGAFIGGMHFAPGTDIVMNKTPLKILLAQQPYEIVWAYTYHILLHEYIHSLGCLNERDCREITMRISEAIFQDADHPAITLARNGIGAFFPNLRFIYAPPDFQPDGLSIEYVLIDQDSKDYVS